MDNNMDDIINENNLLKQHVNELNKVLDREARTPCAFSNFVFHHFQYQRRSGKS